MRVLVAGFMILAACTSGVSQTPSTTVIATTTPTIVPPDPGIPAVVVSRYGVMGWYEADTNEWVIPTTAGEVPVTGGEEYQVVSLDQPVTTAIGSRVTLCEPIATPVIAFDPQLPGDHRQPGASAVLATWELRPQEIEGEWQTAVLETSTGVADSPYVLSHTIPAVADLNGDGKMEIVVDRHYHEGAGSVAYEYINDDLGPVAVLSGGCGA